MPAKNHLTSEQQEKRQKALKREENGDIRERILILLLLNDGKTQSENRKAFKQKIEKENPNLLQVWFWDGAFEVAN
jgi:hypothetical protein